MTNQMTFSSNTPSIRRAARALTALSFAALLFAPAACQNMAGGIGSDGFESDAPGTVEQAVQSSDPGCGNTAFNPVWPQSASSTPDPAVDIVQDVYGPIVRGGSYYIHRGIDFKGTTGDPIYAVADGWVARIGVHCGENPIPAGYCDGGSDPHNTQSNYPGSGHWVMIKHYAHDADGDQLSTRYIHLSEFASGLSEGDCVQAGQLIGYMGQSGSANTQHLHLELLAMPDGAFPSPSLSKTRNPYEILPFTPERGQVVFEAEEVAGPSYWHHVEVRANPLHADIGRITTALVQGNDPNLQDLEWKGDGVLSNCVDVLWPTTGVCNYGNGPLDVMIEPIDFNTGDEWAVWRIKYKKADVTGGVLELRPIDTAGPVKASASFGTP